MPFRCSLNCFSFPPDCCCLYYSMPSSCSTQTLVSASCSYIMSSQQQQQQQVNTGVRVLCPSVHLSICPILFTIIVIIIYLSRKAIWARFRAPRLTLRMYAMASYTNKKKKSQSSSCQGYPILVWYNLIRNGLQAKKGQKKLLPMDPSRLRPVIEQQEPNTSCSPSAEKRKKDIINK